MAGIQHKVIEKGKRNAVSQVFHSKNDKDAIAGWKQDLNRILQIFTVRSINPIRQSLIHHFQAELLVNTHLTVQDTHSMVQDTHSTVADTHLMVADIHRNVLATQAGPDGQNPLVSTGLYPPTAEP